MRLKRALDAPLSPPFFSFLFPSFSFLDAIMTPRRESARNNRRDAPPVLTHQLCRRKDSIATKPRNRTGALDDPEKIGEAVRVAWGPHGCEAPRHLKWVRPQIGHNVGLQAPISNR